MYIITLTKEQFIELYNHILEHPAAFSDQLFDGILCAMELSQEHYKQREETLKELLGISE